MSRPTAARVKPAHPIAPVVERPAMEGRGDGARRGPAGGGGDATGPGAGRGARKTGGGA